MKKYLIPIVLMAGMAFTSCTQNADNGNGGRATAKKQVSTREYSTAEVFTTAKDTDYRMNATDKPVFEELVQPDEHFPTIMLDPSQTFQTFVGIGGAITDASAETFYKLPQAKQNEIIKAYFSPEGIGYSIIRTQINSCDFSSSTYSYVADGDAKLETFNVEPDRKFRIPMIKLALETAGSQLPVFISPWSPPGWMKTNNTMLQGGKLKPEFMQAWADYYIRFMEEYEKEGIPVWGLSVQNEPMAVQTWESCIYTAEEERDFVKNFLGPTLQASKYKNAKLVVWDHNRGIMVQRAQVMYSDPEASKYVWGTGFHWYTGDHFENVKIHAEAFPDKALIFTEGCLFPYNTDSLQQWHMGETYGRSIINDLANGTVAWIDWNILLDETGGPNHVNNNCFAPIIGDTKTGEVIYMNSYYYIGHFSKYIRPEAKRILCSSNDDDLKTVAFLNPDNSIAVVVMNETTKQKEFATWLNNKSIKTTSLPHSIQTIILN